MTISSDTSGIRRAQQQQHQLQKLSPLIPPATIRPSSAAAAAAAADRTTTKGARQTAQASAASELHHQRSMMAATTTSNINMQRQAQERQQQQRHGNPANNPSLSSEVWSSVEDLFWDHMKEVQNKWNTLKMNDDIWAKLIYFEQNRRLAKAYVSAPVLTIDGSTNGLDGFRIGLSGIENAYRGLDSMACLRSIGQGIKLKIDSQGNILIRKVGGGAGSRLPPDASATGTGSGGAAGQQHRHHSQQQCSVWVKDWPSSSSSMKATESPVDEENCMMREIEYSSTSHKLFDMRKFRLQLERRRLNNDNSMDWRQCVSIISFVCPNSRSGRQQPAPATTLRPSDLLLEDPCWLMIINVIAIDMLKSSVCDSSNGSRNLSPSSGRLPALRDELDPPDLHHSQLATRGASLAPAAAAAAPLRPASSSTSVLFPSSARQSIETSTGASASSSNPSSSSATESSTLLAAANERVKKLRAANTRHRLLQAQPKNGQLSNYRRYQSTQQLNSTGYSSSSSSNQTIYTTFNSKNFLLNSQRAPLSSGLHHNHSSVDTSSTSDYNSASRSSSSGHSHHNHHAQHWGRHHYPTIAPNDGTMISQRQHARTGRIDLRSVKSSIKMNYDDDDVSEAEDGASSDGAEHDDHPLAPAIGGRGGAGAIKLPSASRGGCPVKAPDSQQQQAQQQSAQLTMATDCGCCDEHHHQHHGGLQASNANGHRAIQGSGHDDADETGEQQQQHRQANQAPQKLSRSSIASSSSSSGCPDNDYFMSHSSSSMSSSSTSHERELFSQPTSSSGIAGSTGSTSDEYDCDGRKSSSSSSHRPAKPAALNDEHSYRSSSGGDSPSSSKCSSRDRLARQTGKAAVPAKLDHETNQCCPDRTNVPTNGHSKLAKRATSSNDKLHHRRGYKIKTLPAADYHEACGDLDTADCCHGCGHAPPQVGVELASCDCCCDCPYEPTKTTMAEQMLPYCACGNEDDAESIYSRLPHPPTSAFANCASSACAAAVANKKKKNPQRAETRRDDGSDDVPICLNQTRRRDGSKLKKDSTTTITTNSSNSGTSWLEKRKYSKILPKFIFSSSNNQRLTEAAQRDKMSTQRGKGSGVANNLDMSDKFRLTRSTVDLS